MPTMSHPRLIPQALRRCIVRPYVSISILGSSDQRSPAHSADRPRTALTMTMACRHLLIKFSGSRNPVSRRTNASTSGVTAEAAQAELQQYVDKIAAEGNTEEVCQAARCSLGGGGGRS